MTSQSRSKMTSDEAAVLLGEIESRIERGSVDSTITVPIRVIMAYGDSREREILWACIGGQRDEKYGRIAHYSTIGLLAVQAYDRLTLKESK